MLFRSALVVGATVLGGGAHGLGAGWLPWPSERCGGWCSAYGVGGMAMAAPSYGGGGCSRVKTLSSSGQVDGGGVHGRLLLHEGVVVVTLHPLGCSG